MVYEKEPLRLNCMIFADWPQFLKEAKHRGTWGPQTDVHDSSWKGIPLWLHLAALGANSGLGTSGRVHPPGTVGFHHY
jgi:hypothetical protein